MWGLGDTKAARLYLDGFTLHYNYFKPHMGLRGRTPAQAADLSQLFEDWGDVAKLQQAVIERIHKERVLRQRLLMSRPFRVRRGF